MTVIQDRLQAALASRYTIQRELGHGGMATVYSARDEHHDRPVAVKVLEPAIAASLGHDRFLREITITAHLNHPRIVPLLDSGVADGLLFYVMPYVEGESLRDRLKRECQLPVEEALEIARAVAAALSYAHCYGVVHRDIKPENILLSGGEAVVADFGVARALSEAGTTELTESGIAVGTPAYMSPEQAAGERQVDGRSDVYSLGCVLYEMLVGEAPYTGATAQAITARKLTEPVPSVRTVREMVPPAIEGVVRKALARAPADRYATAQQFINALVQARTPAAGSPVVAASDAASGRLAAFARRARWRLAAMLVLAAVVVAAGALWRHAGSLPTDVRLAITTPHGTELYAYWSTAVLTPDGQSVVFSAGVGDSVRLYVRRLDGFDPRPLIGTEGGDSPFLSPDGKWVGYIARAQRELRKLALAGGAPVTVARGLGQYAGNGMWGANDTIYFINSPDQSIYKLDARGGPIVAVTHGPPPDADFRFSLHPLPNGRHALVTARRGAVQRIDVVSLETGEERPLLNDAVDARYVGHETLLYIPPGHAELEAIHFDPDRLEVTGQPATVLDSVAVHPDHVPAYFDIAPNGTLIYTPAFERVDPNAVPDLVFVDRDGTVESRALPRGNGPRFSPDGRRLVYARFGHLTADVFVYDLDRDVEQRITGDEGDESWPIFSADGRRVVFNSNRDSMPFWVLYSAPADGSGTPVRMSHGTTMHQQPFAWTPGGRDLVFTEGPSTTLMDIWMLPMSGARTERPLLRTATNEGQPDLSPDGRWLAWTTDASGRSAVMVRRYPDGPAVPVSRDGGVEPVWARSGNELYFRDPSGAVMMVASFEPGDPPKIGAPRELFSGRFLRCAVYCRAYDVSPDGRRFVMERLAVRFEGKDWYWPAGNEIRVVPHWDREVAAKLQAAGR